MTDTDSEMAEIEESMADPGTSSEYWHSPDMQARYRELVEAKGSGSPAPVGPSTNQQRKAEIEKDMAGPGNSSKYWHSEEVQAEYQRLLEGGEPEGEAASAETQEVQSRINTAFEGIDTTDLDSAFEGLSDDAQGYAARIMADPSQREAYILAMPEAALEELIDFVGGMPDHEVAALERALLLT